MKGSDIAKYVKCEKCGFWAIWHNFHLWSGGCPKCGGKLKAFEVYGDVGLPCIKD